jgi:hypothetical protein
MTLVERLFAVGESNEGSLYNNSEPDKTLQEDFLLALIRRLSPSVFLETGTHKGFFAHFLLTRYRPDITLHTFDVATWSADAIKILQEEFPLAKLHFYHGSSCDQMQGIPDGAHTDTYCRADVAQCMRLKIPVIAMDDTGNGSQPLGVALDAVSCGEYLLGAYSRDSRRITVLFRRELCTK